LLIGEKNGLRDGLRCPQRVCSERPSSCLSSSSERSGTLGLQQCLLLEIELLLLLLLLLLQSLLLLNHLYHLRHVLLRKSEPT
jgi:hypothetical protein